MVFFYLVFFLSDYNNIIIYMYVYKKKIKKKILNRMNFFSRCRLAKVAWMRWYYCDWLCCWPRTWWMMTRRCLLRVIWKMIRSVLPEARGPFRRREFSRPTASTSSLFLCPIRGRKKKWKLRFSLLWCLCVSVMYAVNRY